MTTTTKITKPEIVQKSDWVEIPFDKNYQVTYKVINNNIIHCKAKGYCSLEGIKKALLLSDKIINKFFNLNEYIYIEDFSELTSIGPDARKHYISHMRKQKKMLALVYHNTSPILKLSIKLGRWLNIANFDISIARDFQDSIDISKKIFNTHKISPAKTQSTTEDMQSSKVPISGVLHKSKNYITSYEIINENILHFLQQGHFQAHDVLPVIQADKKLIKTILNDCNHYYMVSEIKDIKITFKARQMYLQEIIKLYNIHPFEMYIFYGANWLIRSAINLSRSKVPFPVRIVNNFDEVLKLIAKEEKKNFISPFASFLKKTRPKKISEEKVKQDIDDLMGFLGGINWGAEGVDTKPLNPPPLFAPLYEGFALLKMELDEQNKRRKLAEEQRIKLQKKLERSMKMEAVGTVAGGVAHDLNNILGGVITYPEIMLMELPENSPLRKDIEIIYQSGMKAAAIVQDLLTLTRRGVIVSEPVDVNKVISEYLLSPEFMKLKKFNPDVEFKQNLSNDLWIIDGSPVHLQKTVMNLIANCAEAIEGKGEVGIVTYNCKKDDLYCNNKSKDGSIVIKITDTGIGIAEDELEKIFEPFFTKKKMGLSGTGLGMAVVWNTVNDHKGFIDVKSKLSKGTTFTLHFPISKSPSIAKKKSPEYDSIAGEGQFILVVDDVLEQREIACTILKRLGYEIDSVSSGEAAVEYISKKAADLLILDMIMDPGIDGLETYKRILKLYPEQKAIIASGFSEPRSLKELFSMKNIRYIKKPYTIIQIGQIVKDIMYSDKD
jgi:signal transduction histidine kinase/CheY-like chemotaxis protein